MGLLLFILSFVFFIASAIGFIILYKKNLLDLTLGVMVSIPVIFGIGLLITGSVILWS